VQQLVARLPWGHNVTLLDKLDDSASRLWYAAQAVDDLPALAGELSRIVEAAGAAHDDDGAGGGDDEDGGLTEM